jgi:NitT/TauT family transport system substrate-binding protein
MEINMLRSLIVASVLMLTSISVFAEDLALNWKPEPEFGGFYEAAKLKAYDKAGIRINILPGGAGQPVTQMVAGKKVMFGIAAADEVILARAQGAKVKAIFAVYQTDPQGFMVHPERKFKTLKDVFQHEGTVALQKGLPYTLWLEKKYGPFKAKIVPYTGGIASFIQDPQFSQQCFVTSEPLAARREKLNPQTFFISDSGFNPYIAVVIVHEDTLKTDPAMVKSFLEATRAGWAGYLAHPEGTNAIMQKLNPSMDLATFNEVAEVQKPLIDTAATQKSGLGSMSAERWKTLYSQLVQLKLVKSGMKSSDFFQ